MLIYSDSLEGRHAILCTHQLRGRLIKGNGSRVNNEMAGQPQLEALFACAATGFAITDVRGYIVHANDALAKIVDRSPAEIDSANLFSWTHPDDKSKHDELLQSLLAAEVNGFVIEKRYVRPDGSAVWVRNSVSMIAEAPSQPGTLVSICEDISAHKRAEELLKNQEQMANMGRLTSSIIHEINNPLEAVMNLIYLARHATAIDEATRYLAQADDELRRVAEITAHGLKFHRQSAVPEPVDMAEMIQSVLTLFKGKLREARVRLDVARDDGPQLICYAGEMRQVFVNLIANAVESMNQGGVLRVRVRPGKDWRTGEQGVRVTIADTGSGMSHATLRRIYEPFVTTKGSKGSGLGLWVTSKIVRKHQGMIRVRSKVAARQSGTVFSLVFPYRGARGQTPGFEVEAA